MRVPLVTSASCLLALLTLPVHAQNRTSFSCGVYSAETWRVDKVSHWAVARGPEKSAESGELRQGPRFACIEGAVLAIEFVPANGQTFLDLHFPDGTNIGYGGQHFERNGRFVLPVQAKQRIPAPFRAAFDYHCRFELPADPISPEQRRDCAP